MYYVLIQIEKFLLLISSMYFYPEICTLCILSTKYMLSTYVSAKDCTKYILQEKSMYQTTSGNLKKYVL